MASNVHSIKFDLVSSEIDADDETKLKSKSNQIYCLSLNYILYRESLVCSTWPSKPKTNFFHAFPSFYI